MTLLNWMKSVCALLLLVTGLLLDGAIVSRAVHAGESTSVLSQGASLLEELNAQSTEEFTTTQSPPAVCNWKPQQSSSSPQKTTATTSTPSSSAPAQSRLLLEKPGISYVSPRCRP